MALKNNKKSVFLSLLTLFCPYFSAQATEIPCNTAKMQAMDKITGRVSIIEAPVGGEVKFGSFSIVVRDCQTRTPEETPEDFAFVDVVDYPLKSEPINIFKGWMLSSNPAINPIEHPIYDVWLLKCLNSQVDESKLLSQDELKIRDEMASVLPQKADSAEIETQIKEEAADVVEYEPESIPGIVNKVMLEDVTFAVSEDVGDEEPNIIMPEYQFKIGE